jgi:AraC-like DNA-binding protein
MIKAPEELLKTPYSQRSVYLDGCTIVESCTHETASKGSMLLSEHTFVFVVEGQFHIRTGKSRILVGKDEAALIKKAHVIEYQKIGYLNKKPYEAIMFFLKDEFLKEFIRISKINQQPVPEEDFALKLNFDNKLIGFIESIKPYFNEFLFDQPGLLRIKVMELLYNLSISNSLLFPHLLKFSISTQRDIVEIMENNYRKALKLEDFAYMAGRSLSSFKRDFLRIYGIPPAKWITEKKLNYAQNLLINTDMSVSSVCDEVGFENVAHFSRLFKQHFGVSPSQSKQSKVEPQSQKL